LRFKNLVETSTRGIEALRVAPSCGSLGLLALVVRSVML